MDTFLRLCRRNLTLSAGNHTGGVCYAPGSSAGRRRRARAIRDSRRLARTRDRRTDRLDRGY